MDSSGKIRNINSMFTYHISNGFTWCAECLRGQHFNRNNQMYCRLQNLSSQCSRKNRIISSICLLITCLPDVQFVKARHLKGLGGLIANSEWLVTSYTSLSLAEGSTLLFHRTDSTLSYFEIFFFNIQTTLGKTSLDLLPWLRPSRIRWESSRDL